MAKPKISDIFPMDKWYPYSVGPQSPLGFVFGGGTPPEITFPGEPLRTKAMIALNPDFTQSYLTWSWVDIVRDEEGDSLVRWDQQIDITYGGRANSAVVDASLCAFRATNDRRFSRRNPLSPYYNQLSEFTPLWIQLDYGQGFKDKYFGFIHDFAKAWDHRSAPYVDLTARGPLHRIGKSKPLRSPLYRAMVGGVAPYAYWAIEDGSTATQFGSAVGGQPATTEVTFVIGDEEEVVVPAGHSGITGSVTSAALGLGSRINMPITPYTDTGRWLAQGAFISDDIDDGEPALEAILTNNTNIIISVSDAFDPGVAQRLFVEIFAADDSIIFIDDVLLSENLVNVPMSLVMSLTDTGASDEFTARVLDINGVTIAEVTTTGVGYFTPTIIRATTAGGTTAGPRVGVSHVGLFTDPLFDIDVDSVLIAQALEGYNGELAIPRLRRLCGEEHIPFFTAGLDENSAACGPQSTGGLLETLRVPEKVDGGTIFEYQFGIGYKSHYEYVNQAVTFTLDTTLGQIASLGSPVDNDLDFVNQWTIDRVDGSSATVISKKGESVSGLAETDLLYPGSDTVAAFEDAQLEPIAARYGRHSTVDEDRWPAVSFNLAKNPELIDDWQLFPFGGRLQALNVYEEVGITTLDQIHRGHQERWNSLKWEVTLNCSPSSVYNIMELDSLLYGRLDSDSSTLVADLDETTLTFQVDTADLTEIWTVDSAEFPLDIELYPGTGTAIASGGETIRVASVASVAKDTFTRVEVDQWGFMDTGQAWALFTVGGALADFDVNAGVGTMVVDGAGEYRVAILSDIAANRVRNPEVAVTFRTGVPNVTGGSIEPGNLLLRYVNTINYYLCRVEITTAELVNISIHKLVENVGTQLSSTITTSIAYTNQNLRVHFSAQGRTLRAKIYDPAVSLEHLVDWQVTAEDDTFLNAGVVGIRTGVAAGNLDVPITVVYDSFEVFNPQLFTANARSLNGIVKAHKAGTVVRVSDMVVIE